MIIPIRCFTCGTILASKYDSYKKKLYKLKESNIIDTNNINRNNEYIQTMHAVGIKRYCCKRHFLGQLDLLKDIK